jgi:hypothetical protein
LRVVYFEGPNRRLKGIEDFDLEHWRQCPGRVPGVIRQNPTVSESHQSPYVVILWFFTLLIRGIFYRFLRTLINLVGHSS